MNTPMNALSLRDRLDQYEKLMRLDKPIGILLLIWPTLWALWLALSLLKWLRWAWQCYGKGGLWHPVSFRRRKREKMSENTASPKAPTESGTTRERGGPS